MSTSYHPQSDGQTEVLNRVLQQYLRAFVHNKPSDWGKYLSLVEWSYNTASHSATGLTPFEITFVKPPPSIPQYISGTSQLEAVDSLMSTREDLFSLLKRKLRKAQLQMKTSADLHRYEVHYKVGDWVYVRLRPYRQTSVSGVHYSKLGKLYYGPYQVAEIINLVAYKLSFPYSSKIHLVFHCSLLKSHHGPVTSTQDIPPKIIDDKPMIEPLAILDSK